MSTPLRVAVVSRHGLVRAGLNHLLGLEPDRARVVAAQGSPANLPDHDVAIYDLTGSDGHAIGLRRVLESTVRPVVVITTDADLELATQLRGQGVAGLVTMSVTVDALLGTLEKAATGRRATRAELRDRSWQAAHGSSGLTERELSILEQIAAGKSNEQIAEELYLSINTIKSNIRAAYKRIGVTSRSQAVIWALAHDLASPAEPDLTSTG